MSNKKVVLILLILIVAATLAYGSQISLTEKFFGFASLAGLRDTANEPPKDVPHTSETPGGEIPAKQIPEEILWRVIFSFPSKLEKRRNKPAPMANPIRCKPVILPVRQNFPPPMPNN